MFTNRYRKVISEVRYSKCYGAQHSYVPLLSLRRDSPPKSSPTFSVRPRSSVGRVTVDLIRKSWVRFPPRSKEFFLYLVWFPDSLSSDLRPVGLSWASHNTLIYTSELILCSTIKYEYEKPCFNHISQHLGENRLFVRSGHMVQNYSCWICTVGLQRQR